MDTPLLHITHPLLPGSDWPFLALMVIVATAIILRTFPHIPEPHIRFKTPFGKLPFFDGVVLYGLIAVLALAAVRLALLFF